MIAWVIARPRPWPRHAGSTKIVPIQPTAPFAVPTPVPTIAPSASATIGTHAGCVAANASQSRRTPQSLREDHLGRRVDVGREHRAEGGSGGAVEPSLQYHPPVAGLTRSDVEHVAFLARLRLTDEELDRLEGQLNHILDQYAKLSELDTSAIPPTAQTIELENILREDVAGPRCRSRTCSGTPA